MLGRGPGESGLGSSTVCETFVRGRGDRGKEVFRGNSNVARAVYMGAWPPIFSHGVVGVPGPVTPP